MKKTVPNPEYEKAYTIGWLSDMKIGNGPGKVRFKEPLPVGIWDRIGAFEEWVKANAVPETIEVDEKP